MRELLLLLCCAVVVVVLTKSKKKSCVLYCIVFISCVSRISRSRWALFGDRRRRRRRHLGSTSSSSIDRNLRKHKNSAFGTKVRSPLPAASVRETQKDPRPPRSSFRPREFLCSAAAAAAVFCVSSRNRSPCRRRRQRERTTAASSSLTLCAPTLRPQPQPPPPPPPCRASRVFHKIQTHKQQPNAASAAFARSVFRACSRACLIYINIRRARAALQCTPGTLRGSPPLRPETKTTRAEKKPLFISVLPHFVIPPPPKKLETTQATSDDDNDTQTVHSPLFVAYMLIDTKHIDSIKHSPTTLAFCVASPHSLSLSLCWLAGWVFFCSL